MQWYYEQDGQQQGPVDDVQLEQLVRQGIILPRTLIWNNSMQNWQAYRETQIPVIDDSETNRPSESKPVQEIKRDFSTDSSVPCQKCGKVFPRIQVTESAAGSICPACQINPIQMGNLPADFMPELHYAGFGVRLMAQFLDGLVSMIVLLVPLFITLSVAASLELEAESGIIVYFCLLMFGLLSYLMICKKIGASPGKAMLSIRVVNPDGSPISSSRASGRWWVAQILLGITMGISHLIVIVDPQKRALHDYIFNTRVIYINK